MITGNDIFKQTLFHPFMQYFALSRNAGFLNCNLNFTPASDGLFIITFIHRQHIRSKIIQEKTVRPKHFASST